VYVSSRRGFLAFTPGVRPTSNLTLFVGNIIEIKKKENNGGRKSKLDMGVSPGNSENF